MAAGAVPGFRGVGGTQAAGISSCKYLRGESWQNVQGVHGSLCWLLASTVMKPDVFSPELGSIKSNHSHCVSNNSPRFSFLILAGSGQFSFVGLGGGKWKHLSQGSSKCWTGNSFQLGALPGLGNTHNGWDNTGKMKPNSFSFCAIPLRFGFLFHCVAKTS